MSGDESSTWDRSAELDRIRATYARYDAAGRERLWDRANPGYARLALDLRQRLLDALSPSLPADGGSVLDLGCGTGELLGDVVDTGLQPAWTGVDLRPEAVERARHAYPSATFLVASADAVPLPAESFDAVVAQVLFSSLPSTDLQRAVVAEVARLLRPGGWLIWSDLRYSNPSNPEVHAIDAVRLRHLFRGWTIEVRPAGLLPPMARRLGWAAPVAYSVLSAVPVLRSHLVGRLQPPSGQ